MALVHSLPLLSGLAVVVLTLQGCGGGGGGSHTPNPTPTPAPPAPGPSSLKPLRSVGYQALPCDKNSVKPGGGCAVGVELPASDVMQEGYAAQWGGNGRDDLLTISKLGANAVRVYHTFGIESKHDHSKFLDRARTLGLHVIPGFHSANICPDFNCFKSWEAATLTGFKRGFQQGNDWHPAVAMVNLLDEPDLLNFAGTGDIPPRCPKGAEAKCRVRAALSALDGLLQAEKSAGVTGAVNLTITWSSQQTDSIDGKVKNAIGLYGFQDMVAGIADPQIADYTPVTPKEELIKAFQTRWTHGLNMDTDWQYIQDVVASKYDKLFPDTPWFLGEFSGSPQYTTLQSDLKAIDAVARSSGSFLGASFSEFQVAYQFQGKTTGIFDLGKQAISTTGEVCEEDVREHTPVCKQWPVYCLNATATPSRQRPQDVASAWGGSVDGPGLCKQGPSDIVV